MTAIVKIQEATPNPNGTAAIDFVVILDTGVQYGSRATVTLGQQAPSNLKNAVVAHAATIGVVLNAGDLTFVGGLS